MSTKKPTDIEPYGEDYNGHHIGSALKSIDKKNPISGHEWTEHKALKTFCVHVLESSPTPTRPALGWSGRQFHSVKLARLEIDAAIALDFTIARISHQYGARLDGTHFEQAWRDRVLADLAGAAKDAIAAPPEAKAARDAKRILKTGPGAA